MWRQIPESILNRSANMYEMRCRSDSVEKLVNPPFRLFRTTYNLKKQNFQVILNDFKK